ncbi:MULTISPECIES: hypothetical protein [Streptomyces]|uniref:GAF domain-containing protein n=3 Tax=Streptomyces TaxID=1883 RepID=A0A3S9PHH3_STRLT|nr:hypothetical protein [Streptomyces luteoverticillatus]AZQ71829.1 hypothetical protein EKH77_11975 [Streptomyces luteoverticillatus]
MPNTPIKSKLYNWLFFACTVLPPALVLIANWIARETHGLAQSFWYALAAALATVPPGWAFLRHRKDRAEQERERIAERERQQALLAPVITYMGDCIVEPHEAPTKVAQIHERLTPLLADNLTGDVRVAYYLYDRKNERLKRVAVSGGQNGLPNEFGKDSREFGELMDAMKEKGRKSPVYTEDILDRDANLTVTLGGGYRSSIVSGAFAGAELKGILFIEAPNPGELSRDKVSEYYVWVYAALYGTSSALLPHFPVLPEQPSGERSGDGSPSKG